MGCGGGGGWWCGWWCCGGGGGCGWWWRWWWRLRPGEALWGARTVAKALDGGVGEGWATRGVGVWAGCESVGREGTQVPSRTPIPRQHDAITVAPATFLPDAGPQPLVRLDAWWGGARGEGLARGSEGGGVWALLAHQMGGGAWVVVPAQGGDLRPPSLAVTRGRALTRAGGRGRAGGRPSSRGRRGSRAAASGLALGRPGSRDGAARALASAHFHFKRSDSL